MQFFVFSQFKCFLKSDFHFIKRNSLHKLLISDAVLMTLIKPLVFTVYFWQLLQSLQTKFKDIIKNLQIILNKNLKKRKKEFKRKINKKKNKQRDWKMNKMQSSKKKIKMKAPHISKLSNHKNNNSKNLKAKRWNKTKNHLNRLEMKRFPNL